jgi:serine/threonine protein kinase
MDWGIAKLLARDEPDEIPQSSGQLAPTEPEQTVPGTVLGTPGYMSPEQARGDLSAVNVGTDIYALGAVLRFLIAKAEPSPYHMTRVAAIYRKAMAPDVADRYAGVTDLMADVSRLLEGLPIAAYPERLTRRAERVLRKYRLPIGLVGAYIAMRTLIALVGRS